MYTPNVGRSLRKDPNNPAKIANIVQSQNTWYPYTKVAKPHAQFIWQDEEWRSIEPGPQIDLTSELVKKRLYGKPVPIPRYLETHGNIIGVNDKGAMTIHKKSYKSSESFVLGDME